jgi:hypothetical protein
VAVWPLSLLAQRVLSTHWVENWSRTREIEIISTEEGRATTNESLVGDNFFLKLNHSLLLDRARHRRPHHVDLLG